MLEKISSDEGTSHSKAATLRSKITSSNLSPAQLEGVYVADSLNEALALRPRLTRQESVVTRDGIWLGVGWIRVIKADEVHSGVLQREHELKALDDEIRDQSEKLQASQSQRQGHSCTTTQRTFSEGQLRWHNE